MKVEEIFLQGCFLLTPRVFEDERGYFYESFNDKTFRSFTGIDIDFVQDNVSKSSKGVLRGLHFQKGEYAQAKLVKVLRGKVLDVAVDLRRNSKTYGQSFSVILDAQKHQQLYIPRGFAHGFHVLEDESVFSYKCDNFYNKASESGIVYSDERLNIDWNISGEVIISEKDKMLPRLEAYID